MSKPTHVPVWATTTLYATSADPSAVGQPTKNDPASIVAQGWDYATRPDPTHFNHWMNEVGAWLGWVDTYGLGADGGIYTLTNHLTLRGAFSLKVDNGAALEVTNDGFFYLAGLGNVQSGGTLTFQSGAVLQLDNGARIKGLAVYDPDGSDFWYWLGPQTVEAPILIGAGGSVGWRAVPGADGDFNYGNPLVDEVFIDDLSGDCTYTLDPPPAGTGTPRMRFNAWSQNSLFTATIVTAEGSNTMRAASGHTACLEVVYRGGAWHRSIVNLF